MLDFKTKGGKLIKTSLGPIPVSPEQNGLFATNSNYRLWVYAVIVFFKSKTIVKFGDHRCRTQKEAHRYATTDGNTVGKLQGLVGQEDIKVLLVEDVTEIAKSIDPMFDPTLSELNYNKGFDNVMRSHMPGKRKKHQNMDDGSSLELHIVDPNKSLEEHEFDWQDAVKLFKNNNQEQLKTYEARDYLVEAFDKIKTGIDRFLLGVATGLGKETSTLTLIQFIHRFKKYNDKTIHGAVATVPSTISELFQELATVQGMNVPGYGYFDYKDFRCYVTEQWHRSYYKDCKPSVKKIINDRVKIIKKVSDIPQVHDKGVVPVLFGSYHDLALKSQDKLDERYKGLSKRIGILTIGEAHQMLGKFDNKMWMSLKKMFGGAFVLPITGTPYDLIYGNQGAMFFDADKRVLRTRNDLYRDKRLGKSYAQPFPDYRYYKLDVEEIVEKLKLNPLWKDAVEGFTWPKFMEYDNNAKKFKYEDEITWYFKRTFGFSVFGKDPLSIHNARGLCDIAKKKVMVALPVGTKNASAKVYIAQLRKLLESMGSVGKYKILCSYEEDLGDIKQELEDNEFVIILTCIKNCTGANMPVLGSFFFMRPIGDSIKFFEQATGRPGRALDGKTNCGIFIGDLEASINLVVQIEEKIALEQGKSSSTKDILTDTLANYCFLDSRNGQWVEMNMPDLAKILEELAGKDGYGVNLCNKITTPPKNFNLFVKAVKNKGININLNSNNNKGAKNNMKTALEQLGFDFGSNEKLKQSWNNLKKKFLMKTKRLAKIKGLTTVEECASIIDEALKTKNKDVLRLIGKGVEFYPTTITDTKEIDINYTNRWIHKIDGINQLGDLLDELHHDLYKDDDHSFVTEKWTELVKIQEEVVKKQIKQTKAGLLPKYKEQTIVDICGGRGGHLFAYMVIAKKYKVDFNPKNVYYNDIDPANVLQFKYINKKFRFGVPEKNITCEDALEKEWNMEFDISVGNVAYNFRNEGNSGGKMGTVGDKNAGIKLNRKQLDITKKNGVAQVMGLKTSMFDKATSYEDYDIKTLSLMVDDNYWSHNTFWAVGLKSSNNKSYKIYGSDIDSIIIKKIFAKKQWEVITQADSYSQLIEKGYITNKPNGNDKVIVRLPKRDDNKIIRAYVTDKAKHKVNYGPKFMKFMNESGVSYTATDEPALCDCSHIFPHKNMTLAEKQKLFTEKNPFVHYLWSKMKYKGQCHIWFYVKKFDLGQIKDGTEIPKEWNLTSEEIDYVCQRRYQ